LHSLIDCLQILNPEGEMVNAELIQFDGRLRGRPGSVRTQSQLRS
jgi:hypothetical protein